MIPGFGAVAEYAVTEGALPSPVIDTGVYSFDGNDTGLKQSNILAVAGPATYALTGFDAGTYKGQAVLVDTGEYDLVGNAVGFIQKSILVADPGTYVLTGNSADTDWNNVLRVASASAQPGRTNLFYLTNEIEQWPSLLNGDLIALSVQRDVVVDPFGTSLAEKLVETAVNSQHNAWQTLDEGVEVGDVLTISAYAKAGERNLLWLTGWGESYAVFDLSAGTMHTNPGGNASITSVGGGWYRCVYKITKTNTNAQFYVGIWHPTLGVTYTGDGTSGLYVAAPQLQLGAAATAYSATGSPGYYLLGYGPLLRIRERRMMSWGTILRLDRERND